MNREILFRGKRVDNGEWYEGASLTLWYMTRENEEEGIHGCAAFVRRGSNAYAGVNGEDGKVYHAVEFIRVDPATVGQYTGLCDKNGKKIFEGDALGRNGYWSLVIEYNRIMPLDTVQYNNSNGISINEFDSAFWEIIGNIHDNPELLEGKE